MRYFIPVFLLIVVCSSCKKPREGYWAATFTNDDKFAMKAYMHRNSDNFSNPDEGSLYSGTIITGPVNFDEKAGTITGGLIKSSTPGTAGAFTYYIISDIKGTTTRKKASGTYTYIKEYYHKVVQSGVTSWVTDTTGTGTGSFEIAWAYARKL
jgi:hypothetical protein